MKSKIRKILTTLIILYIMFFPKTDLVKTQTSLEELEDEGEIHIEVEEFEYEKFANWVNNEYEPKHGKTETEGIFAPWCMYREDFLAIGGHDELFSPQSKEDSDLFNRFVLNGYEVIHHSQFLQSLIEEGKLKVEGGAFQGKNIVYHDSCYLGRANDEYEAPRAVLKELDATLSEMVQSKAKGLCCGAGGAQMWMEEHVPEGNDRVNIIRSKELAATGAQTVAVGCPFCSTMVTDGLSAIGSEMEVKDVAELVWEQIKANDAKIEAAKASAEPAPEPAEA